MSVLKRLQISIIPLKPLASIIWIFTEIIIIGYWRELPSDWMWSSKTDSSYLSSKATSCRRRPNHCLWHIYNNQHPSGLDKNYGLSYSVLEAYIHTSIPILSSKENTESFESVLRSLASVNSRHWSYQRLDLSVDIRETKSNSSVFSIR